MNGRSLPMPPVLLASVLCERCYRENYDHGGVRVCSYTVMDMFVVVLRIAARRMRACKSEHLRS